MATGDWGGQAQPEYIVNQNGHLRHNTLGLWATAGTSSTSLTQEHLDRARELLTSAPLQPQMWIDEATEVTQEQYDHTVPYTHYGNSVSVAVEPTIKEQIKEAMRELMAEDTSFEAFLHRKRG